MVNEFFHDTYVRALFAFIILKIEGLTKLHMFKTHTIIFEIEPIDCELCQKGAYWQLLN